MRVFVAFTTLLLCCLQYAGSREYHYSRPNLPFNTGVPVQPHLQQHQQQPAVHYNTQSTVVHHYGLPRAVTFAQPALNSAPNYQQTTSQNQFSYNQPIGSNHASTIAALYSQYPQQLQSYAQPQPQLQPHTTTSTTTNLNPLTQYQQQAGLGNLATPQTQQFNSNYANTNGGQQLFGNGQSQPYAFNGNYISQSESGQLHAYQHQQIPAGDTKPFSRVVTNCQPNGQCHSVSLAPGQPDTQHQINAVFVKAKHAKASDKCRRIAEAKAAALASASHASGGGAYATQLYPEVHSNAIENVKLVRPSNRRLYEYNEIVLPNDPYN